MNTQTSTITLLNKNLNDLIKQYDNPLITANVEYVKNELSLSKQHSYNEEQVKQHFNNIASAFEIIKDKIVSTTPPSKRNFEIIKNCESLINKYFDELQYDYEENFKKDENDLL